MLMSMLMAVISGILMSVQGVFNTRTSDKSGLWFTNSIVNFTGFLLCLAVLYFVRDANVSGLKTVNKLYLCGGILGAGITYTVMVAMGKLGPAYAVMIILIAQMLAAYLIEVFGLFDTEKAPFMWTKLIGVAIMLIGIVIFQWER